MEKHLVITGGAGFIGSHTIEHVLKNTDWKITTIDRLTYAGNLNRLTDMDCWKSEGGRVRFVYHDFRSEMQPSLIGEQADYFIHMGAESHVDRSILNPLLFAESNVIGSINMMLLAKDLGVKRFIQVSTDEVYGAVGAHLHKEGEPHLPSNPYSASKAAAEDFAYAFWKSYDIPVIITNTMNNFGERQDTEKFVPKAIKAIMNGERLVIHTKKDEHGNTVDISSRCWLHARNHADALLFLLDHGDSGERYNVVGERYDVLDMAMMIARILGKRAKVKEEDFHSFRRAHDMHYGLNGNKLESMGWKPPVDFVFSLHRTVHWYMAHPEWLYERN